MLKLSDYDYELPRELIAQEPAARRDEARLLVVHRTERRLEHGSFADLRRHLHPGDILVINETRVFPARLCIRRPTGRRVELFLLESGRSEREWLALARPARVLKPGGEWLLEGGEATVEPLRREEDRVVVQFRLGARILRRNEVLELCERTGETPLPPYIHREAEDPRKSQDRERYQTVFARKSGAVAAPTAGLHFTPELLEEIRRGGVDVLPILLHVGHGTFKPLTEQALESNRLHAERVEIGIATGEAILAAREARRRVIAVGTTSLRAVEAFLASGDLPFRGKTDIFIKPGYTFQGVDALVTNFHLPRTSLLLLVSAFAGRELILDAYREAIERGYRFYSYGDAMLIL